VEDDLGSELALQISRMMVVFLRRPAGQSQFSATLAAQSLDHGSLGNLLAWIADNIRRELSIDMLARRAAMSPRNFARLFKQEIGKTPGLHVEDLRLEAARRQLESTRASLEEVARFSGFKSAEVLRRVFARRLGTTPGQYRTSFGMRPAEESRALSNRIRTLPIAS
jgi:transcriptional regulator GlxA family with amidase domain